MKQKCANPDCKEKFRTNNKNKKFHNNACCKKFHNDKLKRERVRTRRKIEGDIVIDFSRKNHGRYKYDPNKFL